MTTSNRAAVLLAAALFLSALPAPAQDAAPSRESPAAKKGFGPLEKSLLVPGWGQIAEGRFVEGVLSLGLEAFCIIRAVQENGLGNEAYVSYKAAATLEDTVRYRAETEKRDTRRNQFLLAGAAVWALNLLDIYFIVRGREKPAKSLSLRIGWNEKQALVAVAGCRF
ncbi:MAG: hypothetical protein PHI34_09990 [Acidobacteriota bacterium]|nr:hypothetical protein [Acidobacteriota bacterium]